MIKVRSGGSGGAGALGELTRFGHTRAEPNLGNTSEIVYPAAGLPIGATPFSPFGDGLVRSYLTADQRRTWNVKPTLVTGAGAFWKNVSTGGTLLEQVAYFRDTATAVEAASPAGQPFAAVVQAWLRKNNNVDPCTARQFFGWCNGGTQPIGQSSRVPRVGIFGDGANGFRLGSNNCPDGGGGGAQGLSDADPGFVQPAALLNPGLNWFHIKVKMCPATPVLPPKIGIYLDGALQVAFFTLTNFPRGFNTANQGYNQVESIIFTDFAGVQLNGWHAADWEQYYDTDLTL